MTASSRLRSNGALHMGLHSLPSTEPVRSELCCGGITLRGQTVEENSAVGEWKSLRPKMENWSSKTDNPFPLRFSFLPVSISGAASKWRPPHAIYPDVNGARGN